MKIFNNSFHSGHLYLRIDDNEVEKIQVSQFEKLFDEKRKPLQIMVLSNDYKLIDLLKESGFLLKRKCYETVVTTSDLKFPLENHSRQLIETHKGMDDYATCAEMMYEYYSDTHFSVNPLTASLSEFCDILPTIAIYSIEDDVIDSAAFIEDNEIVYLCSCNIIGFSEFAQSLLIYMFGKFDCIVFEADDTDWAATQLRNMFSIENKISYDTYIKER